MFGFLKKSDASAAEASGPKVSTKYCAEGFNGKYPHVGLYDCRDHRIWVCKPLAGQAIRTSHARLITGAENNTSTVWKDRFLCYWFYTPGTGEGFIHGYPIEWEEAQLMVRIDPSWDYDRQKLIPTEMETQINENLQRQFKHGERIYEFFEKCKLSYPFNLHYIGPRATDSLFYVKRCKSGE